MLHRKILIILLLGLPFFSKAQENIKTQATQAYQDLSFLKAVDLYRQLDENQMSDEDKLKMADGHRLTGDTEMAAYWYAKTINSQSNPTDILHYAQMLQSNRECELAIKWYNQYRVSTGGSYLLPRADLTNCDNLNFSPKQFITVRNLEEINSGHLDYSPIPYRGGIVFTSTRGGAEKGVEDSWTKDNFSDLFYAQRINQSFGNVVALKGTINSTFHDGTASFNRAGSVVYFSRNDENGKNSKEVVSLKIYSATLENQRWDNVQELSINDKEYSTCHPSLSIDGITLYFASNRPGGFGGMDIYRSRRIGNDWSEPENLGPSVNTAGNELFPFIHQNGTLFFASNGLPGVGGLDVYKTRLDGGQWSPAENLGVPINSSKDDFGYSMIENETEGYFSSNRNGGFGGDDIYYWSGNSENRLSQNAISIIDEASGDKLSGAVVTIIDGIFPNPVSNTDARKVNLAAGHSNNNSANTTQLLTDIKGIIQPEVQLGKTYTILVEKQGYITTKKIINGAELKNTPEWTISLKKQRGLALEGTVIHDKYNHFIPNATVELFNLCTGENESAFTDEKGNFEFFLECGCDYELSASKYRFTKDKKKYSTLNMDCKNTKPLNAILYLSVQPEKEELKVPLFEGTDAAEYIGNTSNRLINRPISTFKTGEVIRLKDVYYDFNESSIRGDASQALDEVVEVLKAYPTMEIELYSHTDSRGNNDYNMRLSQQRAALAVRYIVSKGISPDRLNGIGFGENLLKNDCRDGKDCSEADHQLNRRTEIKIVKK